MSIVIHHNPDCGTSRNVVAIVEAAGYKPVIVEYLKTGWTRPQLLGLFAAAWRRSAVRTTEDDVLTRTTVHHVVAVQPEHHIVARSADEDVGAVERLVRDRASLNRRVVLPVIVESDEQLWAFGVVDQCRLCADVTNCAQGEENHCCVFHHCL